MKILSSTLNAAHVSRVGWLRPAVGESDVGEDDEAALAGHKAEKSWPGSISARMKMFWWGPETTSLEKKLICTTASRPARETPFAMLLTSIGFITSGLIASNKSSLDLQSDISITVLRLIPQTWMLSVCSGQIQPPQVHLFAYDSDRGKICVKLAWARTSPCHFRCRHTLSLDSPSL